ncbi:MAG: addiction module toxin RelE, partial [Tannerella sp.]|nr:addiction module toxin RelE [Tannerella sp.]
MNIEFIPTSTFEKSYKRLKKKYVSLTDDLKRFQIDFSKNQELGVDLGNGFRKIRIAIQSKNKGKSKGARIITYNLYTKKLDNVIILVDIYDKSRSDTIRESEYKSIIQTFLKEG